ncbi:TraM recognition domain-containing protein [Bradyrhizobium yuanmingense]|nr:TraM recognition domain-containing protein [Bradyrhizobium yuanmingense]
MLRHGNSRRWQRLTRRRQAASRSLQLPWSAIQPFGGVVSQTGAMLTDLSSSPRTLTGVLASARTATDFLADEQMQRCVSKSTFALSDLKTTAKGMTLYVCLPQRMMETHYRWLRMMTTLFTREMERTRGQPAAGYPVLAVLDEFPLLRRMRSLENAAAQIAGYGVKLMFVSQTLAQLKDLYKDNWETLVANAGTKLFFCNDDHFSRDYVSKLVGECEVIRQIRSDNNAESLTSTMTDTTGFSQSTGLSVGTGLSITNNPNGTTGTSSSNWGETQGHAHSTSTSESSATSRWRTQGVSESIQKRPLITPDEVGRLFGNPKSMRGLGLLPGMQPLAVARVAYFRFELFRGLFDPHPDHPRPPTLKQLVVVRRQEERQRAMAIWRNQKEDEKRAAEGYRRARLSYLEEVAKERRQAEEAHLAVMVEEKARRKAARRASIEENLIIAATAIVGGLALFGVCYGVLCWLRWMYPSNGFCHHEVTAWARFWCYELMPR